MLPFAELITQILYITLSALVSLYLLWPKRPRKFPPGPQAIPLIGNLHHLGTEPHKEFIALSEKYGGIFAFDFGSYRGVVLNDYKLIKKCFGENTFSGRPNLRPFKGRSEGTARGVIFTEKEQWVEHRRFVLKNLRDFGFGKKSMEGMIQEEALELVNSFKSLVGKPISTRNKFNAAVLNSLWRICAGERYEVDDPNFAKLLEGVSKAVADTDAAGPAYFLPTLTKIAPEKSGYNNFLRMTNPIVEIVKASVEDHKETYDPYYNRDLIDAYFEEIQKTTNPHSSFFEADGEKNMIYSLVDLFLAGAETTSTTLGWAFLLLTIHPEVQEKLHQEIRANIGDSRLPELNDRQNMPYTECVILEVLRFSAMVPLGVFHNTTQDVMVEDYLLPKDTLVVANLYAALRDPVWGDPHTFRPERFMLPNGTVNRFHEAHIAFSTGKRVCLGESLARDTLFIFMTSLFQYFHVGPDPSQPPLTTEYTTGTVLVPKYHELILTERQYDQVKYNNIYRRTSIKSPDRLVTGLTAGRRRSSILPEQISLAGLTAGSRRSSILQPGNSSLSGLTAGKRRSSTLLPESLNGLTADRRRNSIFTN